MYEESDEPEMIRCAACLELLPAADGDFEFVDAVGGMVCGGCRGKA